MSEENPYQTPDSDVIVAVADNSELSGPAACSAESGWSWISDAFSLFARNPGMWILLGIVYFGVIIIASFVPFVGSLATSLFMYVLFAGFMIACKDLEQGQELKIEHLFSGFQHKGFGQLVVCGAIVLGLSIAITAVVATFIAIFAGTAALAQNTESTFWAEGFGLVALLGVLVAMALTLPILMMTWFAPALIVFHDLPAWEAMKLSFRGCLLNIVPFLVYGLIMLVAMVVATIPLGLGWLIMVPVSIVTMYTSYKAVFVS